MAGDPGGQAGAPLLLGRYRVEGLLGEGGLGTVVKAFDTRLKSMRAIKTLKRAVAADPEAFRALEERFTREAEAGSRMGINPNLVAVYDLVADTDGTLYLILEYVSGGTLQDRLRQGPAPLDDALRIAADAARGLQAAHDAGLVHRDIKPANIFIAADGRAQVGDFGIAQIDDVSGRTRTTVGHPGTPLYMSPEQARMTAYIQPTSDQYSLGLVLFEMLTGTAYRRLNTQDAQAHLVAFPPPVRALIERMVAENPDDRYPSMGGALAAIAAIRRHTLADDAAAEDGRDLRARPAGPPGVAVGSPDAPTDVSARTSGTPPVNLRPVPPLPYPPSPAQSGAPRGKRGALIGVGGLLIVALVAVGAFFALGRGGSSTQAPQTATAPANSGPAVGQQAQAANPNGGATLQPSQANGVVATGAVQGTTSTTPAQATVSTARVTATNAPAAGTNATPASIAGSTGAISPDGSPVSVKIATPGQKVSLTFVGTDGQAVAVSASKATFESCGTTIAILKPDGSPLGSPKGICGGTGFLDQQSLPTGGTYTLLVNPDKATTGQVTLALYTVADVTGTIMPGGPPVNVKITTPGQNARYTFTGTDGQIVTVQASKATFESCGTTIAILKPDDSPLGSPKGICGGAGFLDQQPLPASGTYTLLVNPDGATTGGATVTMYTVADVAGTIMPGGPAVSVKIATPGQNARYTFTGAEGQAVAVLASKATFESCGTTISIVQPDDSPLGSPKAICGGTGFLDQQSLPTSGTYTVLVDADGATTGGTTLTLYTVVDVAGTIAPGGPPVNVKITTPGQKARYTFVGTGGQAVAVQASKATFESCGTTIAILKPDDSPLGSPKAICGGAGVLDPQTLPTSGTYTVLVDPDGAVTGEATVALSAVAK